MMPASSASRPYSPGATKATGSSELHLKFLQQMDSTMTHPLLDIRR